jgi:hypothetical protein
MFFYSSFAIISFDLNQIIKLTDLIGYDQVNDPSVEFLHYQKIYEYKQNHRWKYSIGILRWYLPTELIPSPTPSVSTDKNISSVNTEGIPVRVKEFKKKKSKSTMTCNFLWKLLLIELQLDSNRESHIVTCHLYR